MTLIDRIYIDGQFVEPHGTEWFELVDPASGQATGKVRLADAYDANLAVAAAKRAFPAFSRTSKADRIALLHRMHHAMLAKVDLLTSVTIKEYGAPASRAGWGARHAADGFLHAAETLKDYPLERSIGTARVVMEPVGVTAHITPWNANAGFVCTKLAYALAAGCTSVLKPSEMSAEQTRVVVEALHEADVPPGLFNVVTGRGAVVGEALTLHPDVAKISFTGSTAVGKSILRGAAETLKRVTLELGGKSPTLILDDADFAVAIPTALEAGFMNSGQACIAGTRILVPQARLDEAIRHIAIAINAFPVGDPHDPATLIGPMVNRTQYERVQRYIRAGLDEGAALVAGGEGHPDGLSGFFVRPTVFSQVTNDMTIARDEIFGPVLCILTYRTEEEAIAIANDTIYGLQAYVLSSNLPRAQAIAAQLDAGRVVINGAAHNPFAPFGGKKQSGLGREFGSFGLDAFLEPKAILEQASR